MAFGWKWIFCVKWNIYLPLRNEEGNTERERKSDRERVKVKKGKCELKRGMQEKEKHKNEH